MMIAPEFEFSVFIATTYCYLLMQKCNYQFQLLIYGVNNFRRKLQAQKIGKC